MNHENSFEVSRFKNRNGVTSWRVKGWLHGVQHIRLDMGVIHIEPEVSKVRMKRAVTIQPNLAAWLRAYPLDKFAIMPRGFKRLRLKFRKHFKVSHDILRHSFISMFVGKRADRLRTDKPRSGRRGFIRGVAA